MDFQDQINEIADLVNSNQSKEVKALAILAEIKSNYLNTASTSDLEKTKTDLSNILAQAFSTNIFNETSEKITEKAALLANLVTLIDIDSNIELNLQDELLTDLQNRFSHELKRQASYEDQWFLLGRIWQNNETQQLKSTLANDLYQELDFYHHVDAIITANEQPTDISGQLLDACQNHRGDLTLQTTFDLVSQAINQHLGEGRHFVQLQTMWIRDRSLETMKANGGNSTHSTVEQVVSDELLSVFQDESNNLFDEQKAQALAEALNEFWNSSYDVQIDVRVNYLLEIHEQLKDPTLHNAFIKTLNPNAQQAIQIHETLKANAQNNAPDEVAQELVYGYNALPDDTKHQIIEASLNNLDLANKTQLRTAVNQVSMSNQVKSNKDYTQKQTQFLDKIGHIASSELKIKDLRADINELRDYWGDLQSDTKQILYEALANDNLLYSALILLDEPFDVNHLNTAQHANYYLSLAASCGSTDLLEKIWNKYAEETETTDLETQRTVFLNAFANNQHKIIDKLRTWGSDPKIIFDKNSPLIKELELDDLANATKYFDPESAMLNLFYYDLINGNIEMSKSILSYVGPQNLVNHSEKKFKGKEQYPLHIAAQFGDIELVESIANTTRTGYAHIKQKDHEGRSVLHNAVLNQTPHKSGVINKLTHHPKSQKSLITQKDNQGNTPLHLAIENNDRDAINALIKHNHHQYDLLNQKNNEEQTPFDIAMATGDSELIKLVTNRLHNNFETMIHNEIGSESKLNKAIKAKPGQNKTGIIKQTLSRGNLANILTLYQEVQNSTLRSNFKKLVKQGLNDASAEQINQQAIKNLFKLSDNHLDNISLDYNWANLIAYNLSGNLTPEEVAIQAQPYQVDNAANQNDKAEELAKDLAPHLDEACDNTANNEIKRDLFARVHNTPDIAQAILPHLSDNAAYELLSDAVAHESDDLVNMYLTAEYSQNNKTRMGNIINGNIEETQSHEPLLVSMAKLDYLGVSETVINSGASIKDAIHYQSNTSDKMTLSILLQYDIDHNRNVNQNSGLITPLGTFEALKESITQNDASNSAKKHRNILSTLSFVGSTILLKHQDESGKNLLQMAIEAEDLKTITTILDYAKVHYTHNIALGAQQPKTDQKQLTEYDRFEQNLLKSVNIEQIDDDGIRKTLQSYNDLAQQRTRFKELVGSITNDPYSNHQANIKDLKQIWDWFDKNTQQTMLKQFKELQVQQVKLLLQENPNNRKIKNDANLNQQADYLRMAAITGQHGVFQDVAKSMLSQSQESKQRMVAEDRIRQQLLAGLRNNQASIFKKSIIFKLEQYSGAKSREELINQPIQLNQDPSKPLQTTLFSEALHNGQINMAKRLLNNTSSIQRFVKEHDSTLSKTNAQKAKSIHLAAQYGNSELVKRIAGHSRGNFATAHVKLEDKNKQSALHYAVLNQDESSKKAIIDTLINHSKSNKTLYSQDKDGNTPLHLAVQNQDKISIERLGSNNFKHAHINGQLTQRNQQGNTPIDEAIQSRQIDTIQSITQNFNQKFNQIIQVYSDPDNKKATNDSNNPIRKAVENGNFRGLLAIHREIQNQGNTKINFTRQIQQMVDKHLSSDKTNASHNLIKNVFQLEGNTIDKINLDEQELFKLEQTLSTSEALSKNQVADQIKHLGISSNEANPIKRRMAEVEKNTTKANNQTKDDYFSYTPQSPSNDPDEEPNLQEDYIARQSFRHN